METPKFKVYSQCYDGLDGQFYHKREVDEFFARMEVVESPIYFISYKASFLSITVSTSDLVESWNPNDQDAMIKLRGILRNKLEQDYPIIERLASININIECISKL